MVQDASTLTTSMLLTSSRADDTFVHSPLLVYSPHTLYVLNPFMISTVDANFYRIVGGLHDERLMLLR